MSAGLNTEVVRRGRRIHIQTEIGDAEMKDVVTHVFVGGRIVVSVRNRPDPQTENAGREFNLVRFMREQHREVHTRVSHGQFDVQLFKTQNISSSEIPLARAQKPADHDVD